MSNIKSLVSYAAKHLPVAKKEYLHTVIIHKAKKKKQVRDNIIKEIQLKKKKIIHI